MDPKQECFVFESMFQILGYSTHMPIEISSRKSTKLILTGKFRANMLVNVIRLLTEFTNYRVEFPPDYSLVIYDNS